MTMAIERMQTSATGRTTTIDLLMGEKFDIESMSGCLQAARALEELLGSVRTIPMSPAPEFGYDPIPLIRSREKTHTLRGGARILGTVNQVVVKGRRIPLWLRWVARERVTWAEICNDEFAFADGIQPDDYRPHEAMTRLFRQLHGKHPFAAKPMWLLHFDLVADLMDELEGRWEM